MNEDQYRAQLEAIYASKSWKITAPLRLIMSLMQRAITLLADPFSWPGRLLRFAANQPVLRRYGKRFVQTFPHSRNRLLKTMNQSERVIQSKPIQRITSKVESPAMLEAAPIMSVSAYRVLRALKNKENYSCEL